MKVKWLKNFDKVPDEPELVTTVFSVEDQKKQELVDKLVGGLRNGPKIKTELPKEGLLYTRIKVHTWIHNNVDIKLTITEDYASYPVRTWACVNVAGEPEIHLPKNNKLVAVVQEIKDKEYSLEQEIKDKEYSLEQENRAIKRTQVLDEKIALLDGVGRNA